MLCELNYLVMGTQIPIFPLSQCKELRNSSDITFQWVKHESRHEEIPNYSTGLLKYKGQPLLLETLDLSFICDVSKNESSPRYLIDSQSFQDLEALINFVIQPQIPLVFRKSKDDNCVVLSEMLRDKFDDSPMSLITKESSLMTKESPLTTKESSLSSKFKCKGRLIFKTKLIDFRDKVSIKLEVIRGHGVKDIDHA